MKCLNQLQCSLFVDGALEQNEANDVAAHLKACASCHSLVQQFQTETNALRTALHSEVVSAAIPEFEPRYSAVQLLMGFTTVVLLALAIDTAWQNLLAMPALPGPFSWLAPERSGVVLAFIGQILTFITRGGDLMDPILSTASLTIMFLLLVAGVFLLIKPLSRQAGPFSCALLGLLGGAGLFAPNVDALELRHDEQRVTISADTVIDDTLMVAAENVMVEGTITGDLFVAGEQVIVRATVGGNLFAAGETLELDAKVSGSVFSAGERVDIRESSLAGNLYAAGERVRVHEETDIAGNALLAGEKVELYNRLHKDLVAAGESVTVAGAVSGDARLLAGAAELGSSAVIDGNLSVKVVSAEDFHQADGALVNGETQLDVWPEEPSRFSTPDYYLGQVFKLLAAFVFGLLLFWLFPGLRTSGIHNGREALSAAAFGALVLVATPMLAVLAMVTIIGLPIGIAGLLLWLIALYAAGIVTAALVGDTILDVQERGPVLRLFVGLLIITLLLSLPVISGLLRLIVVLLGLGVMLRWLRECWRA